MLKFKPLPIFLRWIFRIIVSLAVLFFAAGLIRGCVISKQPPSISEAPWAVQTSSRVYYAKGFSTIDGNPAIKGYWVEGLDGKYRYYDGIQQFPKATYGQIVIIRRKP